jgi:anaerobic glycerol-3-phosphate dehydrogenase
VNTIPFNIYDKESEVNRARYTIDGETLREPTKQWEETTIEVVVAVKAVVIVGAEEMEDFKAEETRAQLQAPNNKK